MILFKARFEAGMSNVTMVIYLFMDGLVRKVNVKVGERGVLMRVKCVRHELDQLLFVDDTVLMAELEEKLQMLV